MFEGFTTYDDRKIDDDFVENLYDYLVVGTKIAMDSIPPNKAVIGLSGGVDSALCAAIMCDAIGSENVIGAFLKSHVVLDDDIEDVMQLRENLGIARFGVGDITRIVIDTATVAKSVSNSWPEAEKISSDLDLQSDSVAMQNIQARQRMVMLMAIANETDAILVNTCNLTEDLTGYATIWGDAAGMFAPLRRIGKQLVFELAAYRAASGTSIPPRVVTKMSSAGLYVGQTDETDLPAPYEVLDPLTRELALEYARISKFGAGRGVENRYDAWLIREVKDLMERNYFKLRFNPPTVNIDWFLGGRDAIVRPNDPVMS